MKNLKRVLAWIGIIIMAGMYIVTLILGITAGEATRGWLMASIACTIVVPCLIYGMIILARVLDNRNLSDDQTDADRSKKNQ